MIYITWIHIVNSNSAPIAFPPIIAAALTTYRNPITGTEITEEFNTKDFDKISNNRVKILIIIPMKCKTCKI